MDLGSQFRNKVVTVAGGGGGIPGYLKYGLLAIVVLVVILVMNPLIIIGAGERGVVLNFGAVQPHVLDEGLHVRVPVYQKIVKVDVRVQKEQTEAAAASKDLQDTHSTVALNFNIIPDKAPWVFQHIGGSFRERVIDPTIQEVVKAITARYTAVELITQREKVRVEIRDMLKERLLVYNIAVVDFSIVNFKFSPQFTQAIENKQTAEQMALKAQRDLDRIKIEAQQKITSAQAEAESLRLQKQNVSAELIQLRAIEASMAAIQKWDGHLPNVTGSGAIPFIDAKSYLK
jgi:regulator of protease activity HflC (stomatin/prohibitin superfamily)